MPQRTLRIFASVALCAWAFAASVSAQQRPRDLFERARMLDESNQNLTEAIKLYNQVAAQSKDNRPLFQNTDAYADYDYIRLSKTRVTDWYGSVKQQARSLRGQETEGPNV